MNTFRIKLLSLLAYGVIVSVFFLCVSFCKNHSSKESSPEGIAEYAEANTTEAIEVTCSH